MKDSFLEEMVNACFDLYGRSPIIEKGGLYGIGIKEWIKWLSYNSTEDEKRMLILINKYKKGNCTKEEFYEVYYYISKPIEDIIIKKLTSSEINIVNGSVARLEKLSDKKLREFIDDEMHDDTYNNLSMIDAYILHKIIKIDNIRNLREMNRKLEMIDNETTSLAKLSGIYSRISMPCMLNSSIQNIKEEKLDSICERVNEFNDSLNGSKIYQKNLNKKR